MRIEGRWLAGVDGVERPVFDGFIATRGGVQLAVSLLIDTGADLTVPKAKGKRQKAKLFTADPSSPKR